MIEQSKFVMGLIQSSQSWVISNLFAIWSIIVYAVSEKFTNGSIHDFHSLLGFIFSSAFWFNTTMALVFGVGGYYRAVQKIHNATTMKNLRAQIEAEIRLEYAAKAVN